MNSSFNIKSKTWSSVRSHIERKFEDPNLSKRQFDSNLGINRKLSSLNKSNDGRIVNRFENGHQVRRFIFNKRGYADAERLKQRVIHDRTLPYVIAYNHKPSVLKNPKRAISTPYDLWKPSYQRTISNPFGDADTNYKCIKLIQKHYKRGYKDAYLRYASAVSMGLANNERTFNKSYKDLYKLHWCTNVDETTGAVLGKVTDKPDAFHAHSNVMGFSWTKYGSNGRPLQARTVIGKDGKKHHKRGAKPSFSFARACCHEFGIPYSKQNVSKAFKKFHEREGQRTVQNVRQVLVKRFSKVPEFRTMSFKPNASKDLPNGLSQAQVQHIYQHEEAYKKRVAEQYRARSQRLQRQQLKLNRIKANRKRNRKRAKATSEKRRRYESKVASLSSDTASLKAVNHSLSFSNYDQSLQGSIASESISTNASSAKVSIVNGASSAIQEAKDRDYTNATNTASVSASRFESSVIKSAGSMVASNRSHDSSMYSSFADEQGRYFATSASTSAGLYMDSRATSLTQSVDVERSGLIDSVANASNSVQSTASSASDSINSANTSLGKRSGVLDFALQGKQAKLHNLNKDILKQDTVRANLKAKNKKARSNYNAWHVKADREQHKYINARNNVSKFKVQVNRLKATANGLKERIENAIRRGAEQYSRIARSIASRALHHVTNARHVKQELKEAMSQVPNPLQKASASLSNAEPSLASSEATSSSLSSVVTSQASSVSSRASTVASNRNESQINSYVDRLRSVANSGTEPKHKVDLSRSRYWKGYLNEPKYQQLMKNDDPTNRYDLRNRYGLMRYGEDYEITRKSYTYFPDVDKKINRAIGADDDYMTDTATRMAYNSHHPNPTPSDEHIPD